MEPRVRELKFKPLAKGIKYRRGGAYFEDDGTITIPAGAILFEKPIIGLDYERVDETHVRQRSRMFLPFMEPVKE